MNDKDIDDIKNWLKASDNTHYLDNFVENGVKLDLIPELDNSALKELGINKVGDRIRIQIEIEKAITERLQKQISTSRLVEIITSSTSNLDLEGISALELPSALPSATPLHTQSLSRDYSYSAVPSSATGNAPNDVKVTVIAQDGSTVTVDISECFSSSAIKRKALKRIGVLKPNPDNWNAYVVKSDKSLHLMYDVELVTVCHSADNEEKNRIILCYQSEKPTSLALATSKSIQGETQSLVQRDMRNIMGHRPPSQLISANLAEYFPETNANELKEIMRNSVRLSMYSMRSGITMGTTSSAAASSRQSIYSSISKQRRASIASSVFSLGVGVSASAPTVGDVILSNSHAVETILSEDSGEDASLSSESYKTAIGMEDTSSTLSDHKGNSRMSIAERQDANQSVIELFDEDDEDDDIVKQLALQNENDPLVWQKGSRIGQGSFGTVYLGLNGLTGELMAVKQVELPTVSTGNTKGKMIDALKQEMRLLKDLNHENIVRYLGASSDSSFLYIFLEYIPGGSVASMLNTYGPFEEPLIRNFTTQTLVGLHYLHGVGIVHRDVKGANILIDIDGTVKISDFGISKKNTDDDGPMSEEAKQREKVDRRTSLQGSVYWMAPEVVKQIAYTEKADIWSVGCLVVEMFTGSHPYPGFSQMQAIFKIGTSNVPEVPQGATEVAKDFLSLTFEVDYKKRASSAKLLKHSFMIPLIASKVK